MSGRGRGGGAAVLGEFLGNASRLAHTLVLQIPGEPTPTLSL